MNIKNKKPIIILLALVIVCAGAFLLIKNADRGTVAVIRLDGKVYDRIDLARVEESYELEINTAFGRNTVLVEPGAISVIYADCPDQVCVKQGKLTGGECPLSVCPTDLL